MKGRKKWLIAGLLAVAAAGGVLLPQPVGALLAEVVTLLVQGQPPLQSGL